MNDLNRHSAARSEGERSGGRSLRQARTNAESHRLSLQNINDEDLGVLTSEIPVVGASESGGVTASDIEPWLIALDIDGTILDYDGTLSGAVKDAVIAAEKAGHTIVLASGRDLTAMQPIVEMLGLTNGRIVCSNGCVIVHLDPHFGAGYWIEQVSTFDAEPLIRSIAEHLPTARFAVEDVGRGYRVNELFNEGELGGEFHLVPFDQLAGGGLVTRVVIRGGDETPEEFSQAIASLGMTGMSYFVGYNAWMDVVPDGVSKASALEQVRAKLGIPIERTLAIGDGHNDIDMLQWAGRGVAMGQADLEVRMAADHVTESVSRDGVAHALRPILPTH